MKMFKKLFAVLVLGFMSVLFLTACDGKMQDGVYRAFKESLHDGAPQVTIVTVTVKDGKITDYDIDTIQSKADESQRSGYSFNEESKKELGYLYGMHRFDAELPNLSDPANLEAYKEWLEENNKLEWFEQAELIEKYWLENGVKDPKEGGDLSYISGVTITDNDYVAVAREAVKNAKAGKTQVVTTNGSDLVWVTAKINKDGKLAELQIDTRQGVKGDDGKFVWKEKTKQEEQYLYGMHFRDSGIEGDLTDDDVMAEYKEWLEENNKLEWFEQVDLLTEYVLKNGLTGFSLDGDKIKKDDDTPEALAGITVTAIHYYNVIDQALKDLGLK
ncbi:MAG TPA: hypothetical protein PKO39_06465 [Bacilli bacterium]|jgi:major membrane immunogen (membrane-anchored lipoprotein)|nr:hypothetical protein [Bacilli bacterium]HPZ27800.1 hypothetical protein [Bacilli bacterium]HQC90439.1 hypothetical protein [Bacilli bacterium]